MQTRPSKEAGYELGDAGKFTGTVWLNPGLTSAEMGGTGVVVVDFAPESRTNWHSHPGGQFLYGVAGRGRVRSRDDSVGTVLLPGDIVFVSPGEQHFHGASLDSPLIHVAINGGGPPDWLGPVTDEEYRLGF